MAGEDGARAVIARIESHIEDWEGRHVSRAGYHPLKPLAVITASTPNEKFSLALRSRRGLPNTADKDAIELGEQRGGFVVG
jgi:hypothetical protein